jgi:hypothetical protein
VFRPRPSRETTLLTRIGDRGSSDLQGPRFAEYWVALRVEDEEARLLDAATGIEYDRRVAGVLAGEENEYGSILALQIRAEHTEPYWQVHREAEDAYRKLRERAGLDPEAQAPGMTTTVHLRWLPVGSLAELAALPPPPATRRPNSRRRAVLSSSRARRLRSPVARRGMARDHTIASRA